jgi:DNA polymerase-3 subunit gamma/tau
MNLGPIEKDMMITETEIQLIDRYTKNLDMQDIGLFWQLTIKTMDDLNIISNENLTLEMYVMQLMHLKNIESEREIKADKNIENENIELINEKKNKDLDSDKDDNTMNIKIKNQLKNTEQIKTKVIKDIDNTETSNPRLEIKNFTGLIELAKKEKEVELTYDLERNVKLVSFSKGKIDISFNEKLHKNFVKILSEKLLKWTEQRWIISLSKRNGAKTIFEKHALEKSEKLSQEQNSATTKNLITAFPDAVLVEVKEENDD